MDAGAKIKQIGLKIDVDTERGTAEGLPRLCELLRQMQLSATIYFSLGPDNTGRALRRLWHPGFLKKCLKTKVANNYGLKTILHGVFWPGPHIGGHHEALMRKVAHMGFEVGIHTFDHQRWQNGVNGSLAKEEIAGEFELAAREFERIFDCRALTAAAPGWQANLHTLRAYRQNEIKYASDCRGTSPFYPVCEGEKIDILQLPTTLPTLDELLVESEGLAGKEQIAKLSEMVAQQSFSLFTLHAELEGMRYLTWFKQLLESWLEQGYRLVSVGQLAEQYAGKETRWCELVQEPVHHRAGKLAMQGKWV